MFNTRSLEKEIETIEANIEEELKEKLLALSDEEFKKYFESLIDKYYNIAFTFEKDYSKYYDETKKKYRLIKEGKSILASKYNNLNNYENSLRLEKIEDIAYKQMIELNSMETSYSNIIYHSKTQELIFINETLTNLIELYETKPSEELLSTIGNTLKRTVYLIKEANKLPLYDSIEDITEEVTFKKEHFKKLSDKEKEELPEEINFTEYSKPILSLDFSKQLKKFYSLLEDLEKILPEDVLIEYDLELNSSEKIDLLKLMLEIKSEEESEEDIYKAVAYMDYIKNKNDKGYLYNILERWD